MLLTLGVFLALAGGTLAVTGAFDGDQSTVSAAKDQYKPKPPKGPKGPKSRVLGADVGGGVGSGGVGAGVGVGAGGAGGASGDLVDRGVCPFKVRILSGTLISGTAADLCTINQVRLIIRSDSPTDFVAYFRNVPSSFTSVDFMGSSLKNDCDVAVSAYDNSAKDGKGDWVKAFGLKLNPTPQRMTKDVPGSGDWIDEKGEAKVRVRCEGGKFIDRTDYLRLMPG